MGVGAAAHVAPYGRVGFMFSLKWTAGWFKIEERRGHEEMLGRVGVGHWSEDKIVWDLSV